LASVGRKRAIDVDLPARVDVTPRGDRDKDVQAAADELAKMQRKDGGWAQLDNLESDPYATGSVLVALHKAGGLAAKEGVYQRGVAFLLEAQKEDGSWYIKSRSKPFQLYFESGFPHTKDQWISCAGSSWATMALVMACEANTKK
jgi:squalene cyclase